MTNTQKCTNKDPVLQLDRYWPYLITVLADRIARRTSRLAKEEGLNLSQWRVLAAIADVPGRSSADVVSITPMDKGIVSRATKSLLVRGLIRKETSSLDGRIGHLFLTSTGLVLYQRLRPQVSDVLHVTGLSQEEQVNFRILIQQILKELPDENL